MGLMRDYLFLPQHTKPAELQRWYTLSRLGFSAGRQLKARSEGATMRRLTHRCGCDMATREKAASYMASSGIYGRPLPWLWHWMKIRHCEGLSGSITRLPIPQRQQPSKTTSQATRELTICSAAGRQNTRPAHLAMCNKCAAHSRASGEREKNADDRPPHVSGRPILVLAINACVSGALVTTPDCGYGVSAKLTVHPL